MDASAQIANRCPHCFGELTSGQSCARCTGSGPTRPSPFALSAGTLLAGQYRIGQVLGQPGGFGITYLAWDERLETRVAIKEFFPRDLAGRGTDGASLLSHSERDGALFEYGLKQFLQEARTLARFDHPNIVRVRTFFQENGTGYLVMDYYEGQSLAAYLANQPAGRLGERLAVEILMPVLDGLRAVHAQGVLHRDIDPHNIYLTAEGRIILLDFGAARVAVGEKSHSLSVILKPGYAPYEQYATSGRQGAWTDVYACAATLYRMLTGRLPPDAPSRVLEDTLRPAHEVNSEVSPRLSDVLQRAMALRPEERLRSAEEFQQQLLAKGPERPTHPEQPEKPRKPPEPKRSRAGAAVAIGIVALLLLAGAFVALRPSPEQRELAASVAMLSPAVLAHLDERGYRPTRRLLHEDFSRNRTDWVNPFTLEPVHADSAGITVRNGRLYIGTPVRNDTAKFQFDEGYAGLPVPHGDVAIRLELRRESAAADTSGVLVMLRTSYEDGRFDPGGWVSYVTSGDTRTYTVGAGDQEHEVAANFLIRQWTNTLEVVATSRDLSVFVNGSHLRTVTGIPYPRGQALGLWVFGEKAEYSFDDLVIVALE